VVSWPTASAATTLTATHVPRSSTVTV